MRSKLLEYAAGGFTFSVPLVLFKCHKELAKPNYYQLCRVLLQLTSVIYCILSRRALVLGPFLCQEPVALSCRWQQPTALLSQPGGSLKPAQRHRAVSVLLKRRQNKIWIIRIFHSQGWQDFPGKEKQFLKHTFT